MNFKYKIGDKVHHRGWKVNCFIFRRLYTEDHEDSYVSYEMFVAGDGKLETISNCTEFWLEEGHRIE